MKQLQFPFQNEETLRSELMRIRQWYNSGLFSAMLVQVYTETLEQARIERMCAIIQDMLPSACIVGCSTNGNIINGDYSSTAFAAVCTLFESPSSRVEVLQYSFSTLSMGEAARALCREVEQRDWVKGVSLLATIRGHSVTPLCDRLSELPKNINVFGGGALSADVKSNAACVFSSADGYAPKGIVFTLYGGDELCMETRYVTGWKPLGSFLNVTEAQGNILKSLNGRPAYETYYKYLHIRNDENFFYNAREFPLFYYSNGVEIMRAPTGSNPDGSLTMSSDIGENVKARLAYGDPQTILESTWEEGGKLLRFAPECIFVYSCAGRKNFWGTDNVGKESEAYQIVAPTSGFYTSGEFLRSAGQVNQHNMTQVIVGMREGAAKPQPNQELVLSQHGQRGRISMVSRMATFIKVATEELEAANAKLSLLAVTDAQTSVANKTAYLERVRQIEADMANGRARFCVAVFDINGLKHINDNYGHECGDAAIVDAADAFKAAFGSENLYRIGGDEFITIHEYQTRQEMGESFAALDAILEKHNLTKHPYQVPLAISKGMAEYDPTLDADYKTVFKRADKAMYLDKAAFYEKHGRPRY